MFLIILTLLMSGLCQGEVSMHSRVSSSSCPLLDGVFVSVMRRIFQPGFHKELLTEVELMLTTTLLPEQCTLMIEETMPRGAFIDPDQLREMRYRTGLRSLIPTTVDIEKPEFESESFRVFLFRPLTVEDNLRVTRVQVPVHLRYHRPANVSMATVRIPNPRLLLSCHDQEMMEQCGDRVVSSHCDQTGVSQCDWLQLPYNINVASIEVGVPVGGVEHTSLVVAITTIVTSGATIYLIIVIHRQLTDKIKTE